MYQRKIGKGILGFSAVTLMVSVLLFSCEKYVFDPPELDPDEEVSFANDITPFFTSKCAGCHGGAINPDLRAANSFAALVTDATPATRYVNTVSPETSLIYTKLSAGSHATIATDIEKQKILKWIQDGAQNN
ncbi:MAG: hypothetical protein FJY11_02495 [Bacteroidetes bacterium]|nr:hypothetical protein [Bacteroidota bacterium]